MLKSYTSRPVSSLRDQPVSPSPSNFSDSPASGTTSATEIHYKPLSAIGEASSKSPLLGDRHSSPGAASLRSSDYSHDHSSAYSLGRRSTSTALTPVYTDTDRLPSITSLESAGEKNLRALTSDSQARSQPHNKMSAIDHPELASRRSPPQPLPINTRRPTSPAGRLSNHSAEWDMHSDRGSPRLIAPRNAARAVPVSSGSHPSYPAEYPASPRMSAAHAADTYREIHPSFVRDREASPPLVGVKRKASISDNTIRRVPASRMDKSARPWPEGQRPSLEYYADRSYYHERERKEAPARAYPPSYPMHEHSAYAASRYQEDDPSYSPRRTYPASPSSRADYPRHVHHDYQIAYADRRPERYSPGPSMHSPPYASRGAPASHPSHHDPYARTVPHNHPQRPSSPHYDVETRPQLPPLSSRPPPVAAEYPVGARYTPPRDIRRSRSPEVQPYPEPFYPDRRLFFARERIQDPELDEYYHGTGGRPRKHSEYGYDAYNSQHPAAYSHGPPPGMKPNSNGMLLSSNGVPLAHSGHAGMRNPIDGRLGYSGPYAPPEYMHDPRDPHAHMAQRNGRPGPAFAAALVPPGPSTGIAPPPRRRGKLPKPVTDLLKTWLLEHAGHPYPTEDEKRSLCSMTGLTLSQVSNWFINARRRILLPSGSNNSPNGSSTAAQVKAAFSNESASPEA